MTTATACATWHAIVGGSDYYWRVTAPAKAIGAKPCLIPEIGGAYAILTPNDDSEFPWRFDPSRDDGFIEYPSLEGEAAVWTRPDLWRATHAGAMREHLGLRTVAETDDNYLGNPKFNIYMKSNQFGPKEREHHIRAMCSHDAVIYSTEWLRDTYHRAYKEFFKPSQFPEEHVVGNHVFLDDWPEREPYDGPVRVGWMGSPSHIWDVDLIWPAMMAAKQAGATTLMMGYDPSDPPHAVTSRKSMDKIRQWRKVGYELVPWRDLNWYERMPIPFDIGLVPLLYNDFTLGKSDIKAVELAIAGAAPILQNHPVYNRTWVHGETCLMAGSPAEFIEHTLLLMKNETLRQRIVANAQQYCREERDLWKRAGEWRQAVLGYSEVAGGDQGVLHGDSPDHQEAAVPA